MSLPKELTTVTPLSKTVALIMFTLLPIIAFIMGMQYQAKLTGYVPPAQVEQKGCTLEAKVCPDGTSVGRTGPNCEFAPCRGEEKFSDESFTGTIADMRYECYFDGICSVILDSGYEIILTKGEGPEPELRGKLLGIEIDEQKKNEYLGKQINAFARKIDDTTFTIYGSQAYYVELIFPGRSISCGGIMGKACPKDYECQYEGSYPDAGGTCVKIKMIR